MKKVFLGVLCMVILLGLYACSGNETNSNASKGNIKGYPDKTEIAVKVNEQRM